MTRSARSLIHLLPFLALSLPVLASAGGSPSVVTVTASDPSASEVGLATGEFTFTRTGGDQSGSLTVFYTVSGDASSNVDYNTVGTFVVIPAMQASVTRTVTPIGDNRVESDEDVTVTLDNDASYTVGNPNSATVTIADDPATVTVTASDASASEVGLAPGEFTVTRSGGAQNLSLTVFITTAGSATNNVDYSGVATFVVIPAGEASVTRAITPIGDNRVEGDETVTFTIATSSDPTNDYLIGDPDDATVTIADDPATVTVTASDASASEVGLAPGEFTFTRSGGAQNLSLTVFFTTTGTATNNVDYTGGGTFVVIPVSESSVTRTITPLVDGDATEGDESVIFTLAVSADPTNAYDIGMPGSDTVTIADAPAPTATITPTATATTTPSPSATPVLPTATATPDTATADHFMAYAATTSKGAAKLIPLGALTLADRFRTAGYDVAKLGALLTPADKNGEGVNDPDTHLLEYKLKPTKGTPKFAKLAGVAVTNQCNTLSLQVLKPVSLLVPAATSIAGPITKPDPLTHERDHFLCYAAKSEAKLAKGMQVTVTDRFFTDRRYDLKKVSKLCVPVDKSGSPVFLKGPNAGNPVSLEPAAIRHAADVLVCYQAKASSKLVAQTGCVPTTVGDKGTKIVPKPPKHMPLRGLHIGTQLGPLQLDTKKEIELCIPSQ